MTLATIPAHLPFLDILAKQWIAHFNHDTLATGDGTILLPGRRAARVLKEAFLRQTNGKTILLPRIIPIGTLGDSETEITLSQISTAQNVIDLPPAIGSISRLATLTHMILAADSAFHNQTLEQAWFLAQSLADLMDEAERMGIDLHEQLPHAVQEDYAEAEHWKDTLRFLSIVTQHWPEWLREQGAMNPVARQLALLRMQVALWQQQALQMPNHPIWAAGFTNTLSSTIETLSAIRTHPQGHIIFPGLDITTSDEIFNALPDTHPQANMRNLLHALNVKRSDVTLWGSSTEISERTATLSQIMLPSKFWDRSTPRTRKIELPGVSRIEVRNDQEEAMTIGMLIRDALEMPHQKIALITPDRKLAQRVMSELERWGIRADDSAGILLADTPTAVLLRLIIQAIDHHFAPVDLLALLKHPLVACGLDPKDCRQLARQLECSALRGAAPPADLCALKALQSIRDKVRRIKIGNISEKTSLEEFIDKLEKCFAPIFHWQDSATYPVKIPVPELLTNLIQIAENLAQTNAEKAVSRLWQGEEGNRLSDLFSELIAATAILPPQPYTALNGLLNAVLRQDRTPIHKGDPSDVHPRVFIWELLEARLQAADTVILAGLSEGIWPPTTDSGPWLNLAMREKIGLPSPEQKIGQAAHDFCMVVSASKEVVLSSSHYREGQPIIPARWLTRAEIFLKNEKPIPHHKAQEWVTQLALKQCEPQQPKLKAPCPKPSLKQRPRQISVTEVETWLRDPYAIYARHVLKLKPLPALQEETDSQDFGNIIHKALERWIKDYDKAQESWSIEDTRACLETLFKEILEDKKYAHIHLSRRIWWKPRFQHIAQWIAEQVTQNPPLDSLFAEVKGEIEIPDLPGGTFKLIGRADRIEYNDNGFTILDYKTGNLPSKEDIKNGWAPQLFLEAAMLQKGAFRDIPEQHCITDLVYWQLTGKSPPGEEKSLKKLDKRKKEELDLSEKTNDLWEKFLSFIRYYDNPETPYCSHPYPGKEPRFAQYARLARVAEWQVPSTTENTEDEE